MRISKIRFPEWLQHMIAVGGTKLIHLLSLCIILLLPELLMNLLDVHSRGDSLNVYIKTAVFVVVFYIEYYWVIPGNVLRGRGNWWRFFIVNFLLLLSALAVLYFVWVVNTPDFHSPHGGGRPMAPPGFPHLLPHGPLIPSPSLPYMMGNLVMLMLVMALALAIKASSQLRVLAEKRHESAMLQRELELSRIRSQINPHLLFNTLNTIYAMVEISPAQAQKAIHQLSSILRYSLYNTANLVTLQKELEFISIYCSLIKMRMGSRIKIDIDIDAGNMGEAKVAPMLLINAVENAMKYGTVPSAEPIRIYFKAADGLVSGEISNSYDPHERKRSEGSRIGLKNMLRRLDLLYGGRYTLDMDDTGNRFTVKFSVNVSEPPSV